MLDRHGPLDAHPRIRAPPSAPVLVRRIIAGILAPVVAVIGFYLWGRSHPYTVSRSVDISAPAARVWEVLSALHSYAKWNPEITVPSGQAVPGAALTIRVHSKSGVTTLHPKVKVVTPGKEMTWKGHYQDIPILGDDEHRFTITETAPGQVRFTQTETFRGIIVPFTHGVLDKSCSKFDAMNAALKKRAESGK